MTMPTKTVQCKTKMVIRPHSSRAVLFYSQKPNGEVDPMSTHGACPILSGSKFAANLWVWNSKSIVANLVYCLMPNWFLVFAHFLNDSTL